MEDRIEIKELNQENSDKILEMCNRLYPEYNFRIEDGSCDHCTRGIVTWWDKNKTYKECWNQWGKLHWFQFCFTWLASNLIYSKKDITLSRSKLIHYDMLMNAMNIFYGESGEHPVDFLYKIFKSDDKGKTSNQSGD